MQQPKPEALIAHETSLGKHALSRSCWWIFWCLLLIWPGLHKNKKFKQKKKSCWLWDQADPSHLHHFQLFSFFFLVKILSWLPGSICCSSSCLPLRLTGSRRLASPRAQQRQQAQSLRHSGISTCKEHRLRTRAKLASSRCLKSPQHFIILAYVRPEWAKKQRRLKQFIFCSVVLFFRYVAAVYEVSSATRLCDSKCPSVLSALRSVSCFGFPAQLHGFPDIWRILSFSCGTRALPPCRKERRNPNS